jgi:hypothetical protein
MVAKINAASALTMPGFHIPGAGSSSCVIAKPAPRRAAIHVVILSARSRRAMVSG